MESLRIAQIAPLWEAVPPATYGGTELVVHLLTDALIKMGHEVTLFASAGSRIPQSVRARHVEGCPAPLRSMNITFDDAWYYELPYIEKLLAFPTEDFDIIHNHMGYQLLPFAAALHAPVVTTLHGIFAPPLMKEFIERYGHLPFVSISDYQRRPSPDLNYMATVYHGLHSHHYSASLHPAGKDYFAFLGRLSPEKGCHHAIEIAKATGHKLIMGGKVDYYDREYFKREIEPQIDGNQIVFIGEVNHAQKVDLLRHAKATLCPVTWPEPFGLVLIESMACGTPVLAFRDGSIPEIVVDGKTGFIRNNIEEMLEIIPFIQDLDRADCRAHIETRFSVERMALDYLDVYQELARPFPDYAPSLSPLNSMRFSA